MRLFRAGIPSALALCGPGLLMAQGVRETAEFWREPRDPFVLGFFFGAFAMIILYNLLLYVTLHDTSYLGYVLFLMSLSAMLLTVEGLVFRHVLAGRYPLINNLLSFFFLTQLLIWMTELSRSILATRNNAPTADRVLRLLILLEIGVFVGLTVVIVIVGSSSLLQYVLPSIGLIHTVALLAVGITQMVRGLLPARSYLVGWVVVAIGGWLQVLREDGIVTDMILSRYAMYWGVLAQVLAFSLALSQRLNQLKAEHEKRMGELLQADKLVSVGTLASSLAHEIANPISAVTANARFLQKYVSHMLSELDAERSSRADLAIGDLPYDVVREKTAQGIEGIVHSAQRVSSIIDTLRGFYRRSKPDQSETVDLNDVVRTALIIVEPSLHRHGVALHLDLADSLPAIRGNAQQLEQIAVNLLSNAGAAVQDRREIEHSTPERPADRITAVTSPAADGTSVELSIHDSGIGIDATALEHIREPFYTTRLDRGGTGMGLYIVNRIAEDHGGTLTIESERGVGTTVTVRLPKARA